MLPSTMPLRRSSLLTSKSSGRGLSLRALSSALDHRFYIEEIAVSSSPALLKPLIRTVESQGGQSLPPSDREGLHPLCIPLAQVPQSEDVLCLLRWPKPSAHKEMQLPLVRMPRGGQTVKLVSRSVDEYLHRLLAEEDLRSPRSRPLAEAAGPEASSLYKVGDAAAVAKIELYLIKKVGMFTDVSENLAKSHLKKGDTVSALVASEWYMRNNHFPNWARPYEFASELLSSLGKRDEEARDMARVALRLPWWTLENGYEAMRLAAGLAGTPEEVRYHLSEEAAAASQAKMNKGVKMSPSEPKTPQMASLENANRLLDLVAAGVEPSYDAVRERVAKHYLEAGLNDVANFISATF